ncbi:chemotaxis protein CheW [Opitutus sp. ER46]|uniref:chemotaxis protein CheW n=1 Tax=Opitutus sp. ER46 TaxID=2161864 RepID=UPI000D31DF83|nr:chemotaxis protein CheW [Opitutus sp. ER46]PTX90706.1 hypothetical protein DB354_18765 [Opitutus sp. ER46]
MKPADRANSTVHLVAQRAGQRFALSVAHVREAIVLPELERVPLAPPEVLGSFQLRGEIVPAVLPDRLLAIDAGTSAPGVLALVRERDTTIGFAFDRLLGVTAVDPAALLPHPLAKRCRWMSSLVLDPRYQLVTVIDGSALITALIDQLQFTPAA